MSSYPLGRPRGRAKRGGAGAGGGAGLAGVPLFARNRPRGWGAVLRSSVGSAQGQRRGHERRRVADGCGSVGVWEQGAGGCR